MIIISVIGSNSITYHLKFIVKILQKYCKYNIFYFNIILPKYGESEATN